jgi:hypothetical protein
MALDLEGSSCTCTHMHMHAHRKWLDWMESSRCKSVHAALNNTIFSLGNVGGMARQGAGWWWRQAGQSQGAGEYSARVGMCGLNDLPSVYIICTLTTNAWSD